MTRTKISARAAHTRFATRARQAGGWVPFSLVVVLVLGLAACSGERPVADTAQPPVSAEPPAAVTGGPAATSTTLGPIPEEVLARMSDAPPSFCGDLPQESQVSELEFEALTRAALRRWGLVDRVPVEVAERFGSYAGDRCSDSWSPSEGHQYALLLLGEGWESGIALSNDSGYLKGTIFHERQTQPELPPEDQWDMFIGVPTEGDATATGSVSIIPLMKEDNTK